MEVTFNFSSLEGLQQAWQQAPGVMEEELSIAAQAATQILWEPVATPGERPAYPIQWDSISQRRAFFASDGFGHGIPTERTGELEESWQRMFTATAGSVVGRVFTQLYYAAFVQGLDRQSSIFQGYWVPAAHLWQERYDPVRNEFTQAVARAVRRIAAFIK